MGIGVCIGYFCKAMAILVLFAFFGLWRRVVVVNEMTQKILDVLGIKFC